MQQSPTHGGAELPLRISSDDLVAYAEGRLDRQRRTQVAGYLACNPDLAAEVMQAVHIRDRIPVAAAGWAAPGRARRATRVLAACVACGIAGWAFASGLDEDGPLQGLLHAPEYVEDAVMSWRATHLRINLHSPLEPRSLDAAELRQAMGLRVPALPREWRLIDTQVYPSEAGPGISMLLQTTAGQLNLFAVHSDTAANSTPDVTERNGAHAAYWELDGVAYVLTGEGSRAEILTQATRLSRNELL